MINKKKPLLIPAVLAVGLLLLFFTIALHGSASAASQNTNTLNRVFETEGGDIGINATSELDPELAVDIAADLRYVRLENSEILVEYGPFFEDHDQFAIQDFILKNAGNLDQAGVYLDADALRGTLESATIIFDGENRKTVRLVWKNRDNDPGVEIIHEVSIFPNRAFIKIDYIDIEYGVNTVDNGRPGNTSNGIHVAYGGDTWIRDYVTHAYTPTGGSYYNRYPGDGLNDPADGGSLNYHDHFIVGVYNGSNDIGYGRVMPIPDTEIIKLLMSEDNRRGIETFTHPFSQSHDPFTGYLYAVTGGESEMISFGQQLADGDYGGELDPDAFQSDDFKSCALDTDTWTYINPLGDATLTMSGTHVLFSIPAGTAHDIYGTGVADFENNAVRIMQTSSDTDFEIEVKFDSGLNQEFQTQGVIVQQEYNDLLRFEFNSDDTGTRIFAAEIENGALTPIGGWGTQIAGHDTTPLYMRARRVGNNWSLYYSADGETWQIYVTFTHEMTVSEVGVYAGNSALTPGEEPAHTGIIDYFFNSASPIDPEDGDVNIVAADTIGNGTVTKSPDLADYACSDVVTITANPDMGWSFDSWSGDLTSSDNPEILTITGDHVITATFTQDEYSLAITNIGSGAVTKDPDQTTYNYGDEVTLTAVAEPGWTFTGWSGDLNGSDNPEMLTITGTMAVTATFTQDEYTLTANTVGNGTVTKDPDQTTYSYGDEVTLTAVAESGWTFAGWSGDLNGSDNPEMLTITGTMAVTASFTQDEYSLIANNVGDGTVIKNPEQTTYNYGDEVTLTAVAEPGWTFAGWSGDLTGSDNPDNLIIIDTMAVTATFTQDEYTLTVNTVGNGSMTKDPDQTTYHYGDEVTLTAVADPGWNFTMWSGDFSSNDNPAMLTITGTMAVTATFAQDEYSLFVYTAGNGSVTRVPDQTTYDYGDEVTLTAVADPGWMFAGWSGDLTGSDNPAELAITGNKTITATFTQNEYTLTVNTVGNGIVTKDPDQTTFNYGDEVTLTAIPDSGWFFVEWSGDLIGSDNPALLTITGDINVTATFKYYIFLPLVINLP